MRDKGQTIEEIVERDGYNSVFTTNARDTTNDILRRLGTTISTNGIPVRKWVDGVREIYEKISTGTVSEIEDAGYIVVDIPLNSMLLEVDGVIVQTSGAFSNIANSLTNGLLACNNYDPLNGEVVFEVNTSDPAASVFISVRYLPPII